jgi:cold shock CspA family protein
VRPPTFGGEIIPMDERKTGRIIKVSAKGWGFISSRDIEFTRIFFHWTSLVQSTLNFKELKTGMMVTFKPFTTPDKGIRAIEVEVIPSDKKPLEEHRTEVTTKNN